MALSDLGVRGAVDPEAEARELIDTVWENPATGLTGTQKTAVRNAIDALVQNLATLTGVSTLQATDTLVFGDASDGGAPKKITVGELLTQIAGANLTYDATNVELDGEPGGTSGTSIDKASNADVDAIASTGTALSTDLAAGNTQDDEDYLTVRKFLRALQRVLKNGSTTQRGAVLLARNADVDSTLTDPTRVLTVASAIRLIQRIASPTPLPDDSVTPDMAQADSATQKQAWRTRLDAEQTGAVRPDGSVPFTQPQEGVTPTAAAHLAPKGYVDGLISGRTEAKADFVDIGQAKFAYFDHTGGGRLTSTGASIGGIATASGDLLYAESYLDVDGKIYLWNTPAGGARLILADLLTIVNQADSEAVDGSEFRIINAGASPIQMSIGGIGRVFPSASAVIPTGSLAYLAIQAVGDLTDVSRNPAFQLIVQPFGGMTAAQINALIAAANIADGQLPASIARDTEVTAAIDNLATIYARLAGATFTGAVKGIAPVDAADFTRKDYVDGQVAANDGETNLGLSRGADSVTVESSTGSNAEIPAASATEAGVMSGADKAALDTRHDSGGDIDAGLVSRDHARISDLEAVTQELVLHDHELWNDATSVATYALVAVPSPVSNLSSALPGYAWALTATIPSAGNFIVALRVRAGQSTNELRVVRDNSAGVEQAVYRAGFHYAGLSQGGFDYYIRIADAMAVNDVLTLQVATADAHTEYQGEVRKLDQHAELTYVHQDSPARVTSLPVGAPIGRQVYLTEAVTHPSTETIFSVPLAYLANDFYGATVADFSSIGGPGAALDQSVYPAIMSVQRISGIWQPAIIPSRTGIRFPIFIAVRGSLGTPTHIHLSGHGIDARFALTAASTPTITVGGIVNRVMMTPPQGELFYDIFRNDNPVDFSLEYAAGFLDDDATIDTGVDHAVGYYEAIAGGQWRTRAQSLIAQLVAELGNASDADKFALASALHATPEVLYTEAVASVKSRNTWLNIQLSRELTTADNNKVLVIRFWNVRRQAEARMPVYQFRGLTPMSAADDEFDERAEALPLYDGSFQAARTFKQGVIDPLFISRPIEDPPTYRRILLGTGGFGTNNENNWGRSQLQIELRSL